MSYDSDILLEDSTYRYTSICTQENVLKLIHCSMVVTEKKILMTIITNCPPTDYLSTFSMRSNAMASLIRMEKYMCQHQRSQKNKQKKPNSEKLQNTCNTLLYLLKNKAQVICMCLHIYGCKCIEKGLEVYTSNCPQPLDFEKRIQMSRMGKNGGLHLALSTPKETLTC